MTGKFRTQNAGNDLNGFLPAVCLYILKGYKNDRELSLILTVLFAAVPDQLILKIDRGIFVRLFKEGTKHIHVQGFSEAPGPGKQGNHRTLIQEIPDHQGLVDVVILSGCPAVIRNTNGQGKVGWFLILTVGSANDSVIYRLFCIQRNLPGAALFPGTPDPSSLT